jgi:L-ascorbate metabolism protein UlaG (beta-lactamase superfamily)
MRVLALIVAMVAVAAGASPPVPIGATVSLVVVEHASLVLLSASKTIWVDPVGTLADYDGTKGGQAHTQALTYTCLCVSVCVCLCLAHCVRVCVWVGGGDTADYVPSPDIILVTHPHGDHFAPTLLAAVARADTVVVGPADVTGPLAATPGFLGTTRTVLPTNTTEVGGVRLSALAAYNLDPSTPYHKKESNWVGYVVALDGETIYLSGDTEDTPEMRALTGITVAFVCANQPYTMPVETAANATVAFKPKTAIPYHHRGQDIARYRELVTAADPSISVVLLDWYPARQ